MKYLIIPIIMCFIIAWCIYFFTHQAELCQSWWFAAEDWCIRYNTTHR